MGMEVCVSILLNNGMFVCVSILLNNGMFICVSILLNNGMFIFEVLPATVRNQFRSQYLTYFIILCSKMCY